MKNTDIGENLIRSDHAEILFRMFLDNEWDKQERDKGKKERSRKKGKLILTNKRLSFESETGFISKKIQTEFNYPLSAIKGATLENIPYYNWVVLVFCFTDGLIFMIAVKKPEEWKMRLDDTIVKMSPS